MEDRSALTCLTTNKCLSGQTMKNMNSTGLIAAYYRLEPKGTPSASNESNSQLKAAQREELRIKPVQPLQLGTQPLCTVAPGQHGR